MQQNNAKLAKSARPITEQETSSELMFRRVALPLTGGMTRREFAHFQKFGRESLR
ncbi:MAG: hypothetical protein Q8R40_00890 [bacterium]|nr:hypothetical protein [bacterium]